MAGNKSPRVPKVKDDKTKKRKRDIHESGSQTKRPRSEQKGQGKNGHDRPAKDSRNGELSVAKSSSATGVQDERETEIARHFDAGEAGWKLSKPMGGRMLDIDPILTSDEQYLILTYTTSIQVFSAVDSLLVRRIPISTLDTSAPKGSKPASIVATQVSKRNPDLLWVACSDGRVYSVRWTTSSDPVETFQTKSGTATALAVISHPTFATNDTLLVVETDNTQRLDVMVYQGDASTLTSKNILTLRKPGQGLQLLEASQDGEVLVGALNDRLFIGVASTQTDEVKYDFYSFDTPDIVTALDVRVYSRPHTTGSGGKKGTPTSTRVVDILVGGARGAIYRYSDAVSRLLAGGKMGAGKDALLAQKHHWHRKAVHAVKWSRDGNYMISGGSENVLVIWQLDTSKKNFLPHLSGTVENIVVSANGSSYAVHLDDNSTMILSTAELKPTAYISGIQSAVVSASRPKDLLVNRVYTSPEQVRRTIPTAIRPTEPSKLHVCVGNGRQATMTGDFSAPLLQSFDLETFTSVSKQALARTQPTMINVTDAGVPIDEPLVTHIAFSADGKWLASVDDWKPSARDVENVSTEVRDRFIRERHEVYLKFWEVRDGAEPVGLVSRVNSPHATDFPETVLDLASDPNSSCFATIGGDGRVRLWRAKTRQENGIAIKGLDGQDAVSWSCSQVIDVGDGLGHEISTDVVGVDAATALPQGSVTFSEDGSTVFAAFGTVDSGVVYVIDSISGEIVKTMEGLWKGHLQSIRSLSPYVVVLSDDLTVYDVVGDELRYGITVPRTSDVAELLQLAVDHTSGHFAVTLPMGDFSSIGVFDPEEPEPLLVRSMPHRVVSLTASPDASGFIALDDAAQIWVIAEGSDPYSLSAAQPLQDLRLDGLAVEDGDDAMAVAVADEDDEMASDDEDADQEETTEDVDMDDDNDTYASVVPQQYLADIFDATPAFAAPSIEDMFYKVTSLLATKPLSAPTA